MEEVLKFINEKILEYRKTEEKCDQESMRLCESETQKEAYGIAEGRATVARQACRDFEALAGIVKREMMFIRKAS